MMKGVQLHLDLFNEDEKSIVVIVERPNGTTFEQKVKLKENEEPKDAAKRYQKILGEPYGWYTIRGKRLRYLKKDAYLVVDWRIA